MRLFAKGDRVTQPNYGPGTITEANAYHTVIEFDEHGVRTFVTDRVILEPTSSPAPARAKNRGKRAPRKKVEAKVEAKVETKGTKKVETKKVETKKLEMKKGA
jgi:hypothetical protein